MGLCCPNCQPTTSRLRKSAVLVVACYTLCFDNKMPTFFLFLPPLMKSCRIQLLEDWERLRGLFVAIKRILTIKIIRCLTLYPQQISPGTALTKPIPSIWNTCSSIKLLLINIAPIPPDLLHYPHSHHHLHCQCQGRQSLHPSHPDQSPHLLSHTFK